MSNTRDLEDQVVEVPFGIPNELVTEIVSLASQTKKNDPYREATRIIAKISEIRKPYHAFFKPELDARKIKQTLIAVLQGNEKEALYFAKNHPEWFFIKIKKTKDYAMDLDGNCRELEDWSAYQAIFGTGDKDMFLDKEDKPTEIKKCLDAYLDTLPNGHAMAYEQEQEKFPHGFDYPESTYDFTLLVDTIANDQQLIDTGIPSDATFAVLAAFRADFKPGVVKTGYHFNMNDFIKAHAVYDQNWNPWNGNQLAFFSQYIIGFLDRLLSAPYMQRACQGTVNQDQPLKRSYEVKNYVTNKNIAVFPLDGDPSCRLGDGFLVDSYYGVGRHGAGRRAAWLCGSPWRPLENYVKKTQRSFQDLRTRDAERSLRV